jgi:uncharacterized membrane protein YfcA
MLAVSFFIIALLYATVGFGGGSSYLAMLAISNTPYALMPKIGLICNLLVVSGGCWHYFRAGFFNRSLILPFVLTSVPLAFLGGMYPVSEKTFLSLLAGTLVLAGLRLLFIAKVKEGEVHLPPKWLACLVGGFLGLISGVVGIGGGIFLSPLMLNMKWGRPKEVEATASAFIWLNSIAGLIGQLTKGFDVSDAYSYWPIFLAVVVGGQIGSLIGTHPRISQQMVQRGTALLILVIAFRLLFR